MYELWRTRQRNGEVEEAMKSAEYKSTSFHVDAETEFAEDEDECGLFHVDHDAAAVSAVAAVAATTRKRKKGSKTNAANDKEDEFSIPTSTPPRPVKQIPLAAGGDA
jgi:hypothetical protein